jgi:ribosome-associated translation inhibitor RaiA
MKVSFTYKHNGPHDSVEKETERYTAKLSRLLKAYSPDLVQLHGALSKHPRKVEFSLALNLSLPTGTLHATGLGSDLRSCCKQAFSELEAQVKKHQAKLRKDYEWKRKRRRLAEALS